MEEAAVAEAEGEMAVDATDEAAEAAAAAAAAMAAWCCPMNAAI